MITMGEYGSNALVVCDTKVGVGTATPNEALTVVGSVSATCFKKAGGTSSQFLKADGSVDSTNYGCGDIICVCGGTNLTGCGSSGTVTLNMATGGAGAGTYGNTGDACKIDSITVDAYGRVTAVACGPTGSSCTNGTVTNVAGCDGITVNNGTGSACVCVNSSVVRTTGNQIIAGTKSFTGSVMCVSGTIKHTGDADTCIAFGTNTIALATGGECHVSMSTSGVVINEPGNPNDFRVEGDTDTHALFVDGSADKVGIGTSTPSHKLDVESADDTVASFNSTDSKASIAINDDDTTVYVSAENGKGAIGFQAGAHANNLNIDSSGKVGIGTTSPAQKLDVTGKIAVNGQTVVYVPGGNFTGSSFYGDGGGSLCQGTGPYDPFNDGLKNTGVGIGALYSTTTGQRNTATGYQALYSNTTGTSNIATGPESLYSNTTGFQNTATGYRALYANTTGSNNVAIGYQSLVSNTTGGENVATGLNALLANTTGCCNVASGYESLRSNTTGACNTATGFRALYSNTTGTRNVAVGQRALCKNTTGLINTAIGDQALAFSTTSSQNTRLYC